MGRDAGFNGLKSKFSINTVKLVTSRFEQMISKHSEWKFHVVVNVLHALTRIYSQRLEVSLAATHSGRDLQKARNLKWQMVVRFNEHFGQKLWKLTTIVLPFAIHPWRPEDGCLERDRRSKHGKRFQERLEEPVVPP